MRLPNDRSCSISDNVTREGFIYLHSPWRATPHEKWAKSKRVKCSEPIKLRHVYETYFQITV